MSSHFLVRVGMLCLIAALLNTAHGQAVRTPDQENRMKSQTLEDKAAIKELLDRFSILADQKQPWKQVELFTKTALLESYRRTASGGEKGQRTSRLEGPQQIGEAFENFLKNFETVYHFNGQSIAQIDGDKATGISYCTVNLVSNANGRRTMTTFGVHYNDEFVRENGQWLFSKRTSIFDWETRQELP